MAAASGVEYLVDGVPLVVVALGLFAIPEIIDLLRRYSAISQVATLGRGWLRGIRDTLREWSVVLRCSGIGCLIGAMPGLGGSVADWMAYGTVQLAKDKSQFGRGDVRGVLAPESANNAVSGALVPTLLFGIPGSGSTAIFLGGMVLLGIQPGIMLVETQLDLVYTIIWTLAIANVVGAALCFAASPFVARITTLPYAHVAPFMLMVIFFAAYQATSHWGDILALLAIGVLGLYMRRLRLAAPAAHRGLRARAGRREPPTRRSSSTAGRTAARGADHRGDHRRFDVGKRTLWPRRRSTKAARAAGVRDIRPQLAFAIVVTALFAYAVLDLQRWSFLGKGVPARRRDRGASGCAFCRRRHLARVARELGDLRYRVQRLPAQLRSAVISLDRRVARRERTIRLLDRACALLRGLPASRGARADRAQCLLTASASALFAAMSHLFVLDFPRGLLQGFEMPWPLRRERGLLRAGSRSVTAG